MRTEPAHAVAREHVPLREIGVRLGLRAEVRDRIGQHLQRDLRPARVARQQRDDGGEVAAGAIAADGEPRGIDA